MRMSTNFKFLVLCPCGESYSFRTVTWARTWGTFHEEQTGHDYITLRAVPKS